jgi:nuclear GTP-binding protein
MKVKKPQSKRKSTKLQKGIEKKVAAHNRKQKKLAKKDVTWKSRVPKDPGIPNSFPYKGKVLEEMEVAKRQEREEKERRREEKRQAARAAGMSEEQIEEGLAREEEQENTNRLAALMESAQAAAEEYNGDEGSDVDMEGEDDEDEIVIDAAIEDVDKETSRKAYDKIYKQVVANSDVILYVLDARNPEGTRSKPVEHHVLANPEKRLIYVINKIDLIPDEVLTSWKEHLELFFPVIPLSAANCAPNAQTFEHGKLNRVTTANSLLQCLKKYSQKKRSTSVGIIGYPNVGKSSVINALTSRHGGSRTACPVGAQAGVTTSIRKVKVDNKLAVWDSPGIVFPSEGKKAKKNPVEEQARLVLLNAVPPKQMDDLRPAVSLLLKRLQKVELLDRLYNTYSVPPIVTIPHEKFVTEFLVHVARKMGRLGKQGVPDLDSAAQAVITDWRDGRIVGWEMPPNKSSEKNTSDTTQPVVVNQWAQEFSLDSLWDPNVDIMQD